MPLCVPLAVDTPLLTFRGGAIFEVGLQKFYFEFRDAVERWELYKVSLQFFCIKCAEVIIIYIKSVIFSSFVSVSRHSQRRKKKKNNFIYYLGQQHVTLWEMLFLWRFYW